MKTEQEKQKIDDAMEARRKFKAELKDPHPSGIQKAIIEELRNNPPPNITPGQITTLTNFAGECTLEIKETIYQSECPPCPEDDPRRWPEFWSPEFFYRTISMDEINPTSRGLGENWDNAKGRAAIGNELNPEGISLLGDNIYNDATEDYLEYRFVLGPREMQDIRQDTSENSYYDFSQFTCMFDSSKECHSRFLTDLAATNADRNVLAGRDMYKYFINGKFERGSAAPGGSLNHFFKLTRWIRNEQVPGFGYPDLHDIKNEFNKADLQKGLWP